MPQMTYGRWGPGAHLRHRRHLRPVGAGVGKAYAPAGGVPFMRLLASLLTAILVAMPVAANGPGDDHEVIFDPAADIFPTADEVKQAIEAARGHAWVTVHDLGVSGDGRPLTILEITDPDSTVPREQRVVTLIETQQHGNEPAGTGAAVPLIHDLLAGAHPADTLDNQVLLLLPMSNPDGATANTRGNKDGVDINRDHIALETTEAQTMHAILNRWDVHVAIDHHEYSGTGLGSPVPVQVYDYDLTMMYPNHGNVRKPTFDAAHALNYEGIWPAAQAKGYTVGNYGVITAGGVPVQETAGGPDPGILRNNFGLNNVAGLLGETFISAQPENPFQSAERRIAIHRVVMDATLQWAHDHADALIEAKRESERLNLEEPMTEYIEPALGGSTESRGPMPAAFRTTQDLSGLFTLHGLPMAAPAEGGFVHNVAGQERAGLVAAILHPQSSRHVADATPTDAILAEAGPANAAAGSNDTPLGLLVALAAVGAALAVARRR